MKNNNQNNKNGFWREVFSEDGVPSSKRIVGAFMILCTQICLITAFFMHGVNSLVQDLCELNIIVGASLIGLNAVTSIWKGGNISINNDEKKKDKKEDA